MLRWTCPNPAGLASAFKAFRIEMQVTLEASPPLGLGAQKSGVFVVAAAFMASGSALLCTGVKLT